MRLERAAWALLLGSSVLYFFSPSEADNDLWGHLLFGREILAARAVPRIDTYSYTAYGAAWIDHEWLSQALMAAIYDAGGPAALVLAKLAVASGAFLLLLRAAWQRAASVWVCGSVGLLAIAVMSRGFSMRPQIFSYFGIALLLYLLDRSRRASLQVLWWLPLMFWLWVNLHGGFALGLAILALFVAAGLVRGQRRVALPAILAMSVAVTAINPYGPRLLVYIWDELNRAHPITEWQPVGVADTAHFVFLAMLGLFVASIAFARRWRELGWEIALAGIVGYLALQHQRHTPIFALCAMIPLATQLQNLLGRIEGAWPVAFSAGGRRLLASGLIILALLQLALTADRLRRHGLEIVFDPNDYPTAAVHALQKTGAELNLAVPLEWGEYALWFLAPRAKVSLDGRFATVFPQGVVQDNFVFYSGAAGWRRLLDRYPTQAALVPAQSACPITATAEWELVFRDQVASLYARTGSAAWADLQQLRRLAPQADDGVFP